MMASTVSSSTSSTSSAQADIDAQILKLATTFQTAISATIDTASAPLKKVQAQSADVDVRKAVYTDLKNNFDALQSAVQGLISTQASYAMGGTAKSTVTPFTSGSTVFTATTQGAALSGEYDISVTTLARAQTQATAAAASSDLALNKSGTIWLGGTGKASVDAFMLSDSVTAATIGTVASGQRELGSTINTDTQKESYSLQVRDSSDGVRQFRLTNADGTAVSIRSSDGSGFTDSWQTLNSGAYDTGRGLVLTLSSAGAPGSTSINYTARGTSITIKPSDTQRTIATAINNAIQPEGHDFKASVVANTLVLSGAQSGVNHSLLYTDGAGLGFGDLQPARNASFTVNGMTISRASNSSLTDVIDGVTLNLAGDAEAKGGHLSVVTTTDKAASAMTSMVSSFNDAITHLTQKMAITASTSGATTSYTRSTLTGDTVFSNLRTDMYTRLSRSYTNSGSFKNLSDIGLTMDSNMKLVLDSAKFSAAMQNHATDVTALLDTAMGQFDKVLSGYTGSNGALQKSMNSMDDLKKSYDSQISRYNTSLTTRKQSLYNMYIDYQNQLVEMNYQSNMLNLLLYGTSTTTSTSGSTTGSTLSSSG
jgi:flagellar hook-associated protein 2